MKKILVIDDEAPIRSLVKKILEREGFEVGTASNGNEGLNIIIVDSIQLIITDIIMPDKEGLETIRELKKQKPEIPIIAMSGGGHNSADGYLKTAKIMGANEIIEKPIHKDELLELVRKFIR